jgi:hypothetical protein
MQMQQDNKEALARHDDVQLQLTKEIEGLKIQIAKCSEEKLEL